MIFEKIHSEVEALPFIAKRNAELLYNFIRENDIKNVLELGIAHGKSSCYIAAALEENGNGKLTCVDLQSVAKHFIPAAEELIHKFQFSVDIEIHRMQSGYNWFLHNQIRQNTNKQHACTPEYDLIIIDGPKNWIIDSSSFFLSDKLLRSNGWIIWDDYNWTYGNADKSRDTTDGITHRSMSEEELSIPHIKEVFELLVIPHPHYGNFKIYEDSDWAWAQKVTSPGKTIAYKSTKSVSHVIGGFLNLVLTSLMRIASRSSTK
jgi:predicted O-methyltransferase YrrM